MKFTLALLGVSAFVSGCAPVSLHPVAQPVEIRAGGLEFGEAITSTRHANAVDLLYFNPENQLVMRRADGSEQVLNQDAPGDSRRANAVLHSDGQALYALWRPKLIKPVDGLGQTGAKLVYFRASLDDGKTFGPVQRLNQQGGAFQPFIASSGKGDVYVAWTDERNGSSNIDIYLNASNDRGANWKKQDFKLNGAESTVALNPSVVADGENAHVSWMTIDKDKQFKIFVRSTHDRGQSWLAPVAVNVAMEQPTSPSLVKTSTGLLMCWGVADIVRCSSSTDHGKTWSNSAVVADSKGMAGLVLASDPKGKAHLLIAKKTEEEKSAVNLFHAASSGAAEFGPVQRLSGGLPFKSSTVYPAIKFGDDSSVLVTWMDMRYIRSVVAANYSADGGKTWLANDVVLAGKKGMFNYYPTASYAGGGKYAVAWQETANRSEAKTVIGQMTYKPGSSGVAMAPPDAARLKTRADEFWTLREKEQYGAIFDMMDPYFKEINTRKGYEKSQGSVTYHAHRVVGEPMVTGNSATIKVAYDSEVPELMLKGKKISVPRQEVEIEQEWVWVDGDWFQVFRDLFGGSAIPN